MEGCLTVRGRRFSHLSWKDRLKIERMIKDGYKIQSIADALHVHNSTIYREIKKGKTTQLDTHLRVIEIYCPETAQRKYREMLSMKGPALKIGNDRALADYIEDMILNEKYSPGAALYKIVEDGLKFSVKISRQTVYAYIRKGVFRRVTYKDLPYGRKIKHKRDMKEGKVPRGESIENRPQDVGDRSNPFHWEMDSVLVSKKSKKRLLVLTERKSRYEIIVLIKDGKSFSVVSALNRIEKKMGYDMFSKVFKSITVDNGTEFSDCAGLEMSCLGKGMRTKLFYCHPYSAFERGSNENANRIIRRWLPKGVDFDYLTSRDVRRIQDWINGYPRGTLGGQSAGKVFREYLKNLK